MEDGRISFGGDAFESPSPQPTWSELGAAIQQLAAELMDEIARNPEQVAAAILLVGGSAPSSFDASMN